MEEKEQQEIIFKLSMFEQQGQQIQQQLQAIEQGINEMQMLNSGLNELVGAKGKEIRAPIGRGIFAEAKLLSEDLIVDVGSKNLVKKSIPETKKIIDEQIVKLNEVQKDLKEKLMEMQQEMMELVEKVQNEQESDGKKE